MQTVLKNYLLQFNYCPLKGLGNLVLKPKTVAVPEGDMFVFTHTSTVHFEKMTTIKDGHFIEFVRGFSPMHLEKYEEWCQQIAHLAFGETVALDGVGLFKRTIDDKIVFEMMHDTALERKLSAPRVTRNDASHQMLVGDLETNTTYMADKLGVQPAKKQLWWIAAVIIAAISVACICLYYFGGYKTGFWGNSL